MNTNKGNKYLEFIKLDERIPKKFVEFLEDTKDLVLYGNGNQGLVLEEALVDAMNFEVAGFLRSDQFDASTKRYSILPSYKLSESPFEPENTNLIIALGHKNTAEVLDGVKAVGYTNIYTCEDWEPVNSALREIRFQSFLKDHNLKLDKSADILELGDFRFVNPWKEERLLTFFLGHFGDLVAAPLFDDYTMLETEGPYCYGEVTVKDGDVVLDLGANIGLFSTAAAALGAQVYSFEPIEFIRGLLKKSTNLYDNIEIVPYAAGSLDGMISFYEVAEDYHDIGSSSIMQRDTSNGYRKVELPAMTIDSFVESKHLEKVDFIKADIEGSEREMLKGAVKTLKEFAPKLSLCTYHLPDDKEVLTNLILAANPNYVIEYKWEKLFAYVPTV